MNNFITMSEEEELSNPEIPEIFYNYSTGQHFTRCIDCDRDLLTGDLEYFIEKAIKAYKGYQATDVIFEYAICIHCAEKMKAKMSAESLEKIQEHFMQNIKYQDRLNLIKQNLDKPENWIDKCMITGANKEEIDEYQIYAHCKGNELITTQMPYMLSGAALDEISTLLSSETLDELDGFMNDNFGPPPELEEELSSTRRPVMF